MPFIRVVKEKNLLYVDPMTAGDHHRVYQDIFEAALPYLRSRSVAEVVMGRSLTMARLDDGNIGCSCSLESPRHSPFNASQTSTAPVPETAEEAGALCVTGETMVWRSVGLAVLNGAVADAAVSPDNRRDIPLQESIPLSASDRLGMIGYIRPIADWARSITDTVYVFDDSLPGETLSRREQPRVLPLCTHVLITGSTLVNRTLHEILRLSGNAETIALVGPSVCLLPKAYSNTQITVLAGCLWDHTMGGEISKKIAGGAGMKELTAAGANTRVTLRRDG